MFAMQVQFLLDLDSLPGQALLEWPPQRSQLLCALADTAQHHRLGASARAALLWLEAQFPPAIHAVPSSDARGLRRLTVTYVWHDARPDATLQRILRNVTERIAVFGSDRTAVRVRLCDAPSEPFAANGTVNQPQPSRVRRFRRRPPRPTFRNPTPSAVRSGPFGEMIVFRLPDDVHLNVTDTLDLTSRLRAAVLKQCGHPERIVPELLSGHDDDNSPSGRPHAAYVALPCVGPGPSHADGGLAGLAIVLPAGVGEQERRLVQCVAGSIRRLWLPGGAALPLELLPPQARHPVLRLETWCAAARQWASVTPVVLDRFPRRDGRDLEDIVRTSCRTLGLPDDVEVNAGPTSPLPGIPSSDAFRIRREAAWQHHTVPDDRPGPPRPSRHVTLHFTESVRGPLLVGHGRYFGLGLLRPLPEQAGRINA